MARQNASKVKEAVASWSQVRQLLRNGDPADRGSLVPVVIPKDKRSFRPFTLFGLGLYALLVAIFAIDSNGNIGIISAFAALAMLGFFMLGLLSLVRSMIVEIEEGTNGIMSNWGKFTKVLQPGRQYIWKPWQKVEYIVDTSTEIPYNAPVTSSPTMENVPLKSIEFFLKFRINDPEKFVRNIGASNFDIVLSSAVQDAIRQRSRMIKTADAYSLRGSNVTDMQDSLNAMLQRYGVRVTGANIPDVQLAEQYQNDMATKERVAKEQSAYEKEWDLKRKQSNDRLELEIEQARKTLSAKLIAVNEAENQARESVAIMLQEKEAQAEKIRLDIEARSRADLESARHQAESLRRRGEAYKDNWAVLQYELELDRLNVAENLMRHAPRPVVVRTGNGSSDQGGNSGGNDMLSMLVMAQLLPDMMKSGRKLPSLSSLTNRRATQPQQDDQLIQVEQSDEVGTIMSMLGDEIRKLTGS